MEKISRNSTRMKRYSSSIKLIRVPSAYRIFFDAVVAYGEAQVKGIPKVRDLSQRFLNDSKQIALVLSVKKNDLEV